MGLEPSAPLRISSAAAAGHPPALLGSFGWRETAFAPFPSRARLQRLRPMGARSFGGAANGDRAGRPEGGASRPRPQLERAAPESFRPAHRQWPHWKSLSSHTAPGPELRHPCTELPLSTRLLVQGFLESQYTILGK